MLVMKYRNYYRTRVNGGEKAFHHQPVQSAANGTFVQRREVSIVMK